MRLREVVFHHVDLDAGFGFADIEPDLLRLFLEEEVARVRAADDAPDVTLTTPEGDQWTIGSGRHPSRAPAPPSSVARPRAHRRRQRRARCRGSRPDGDA